MSNKRLLDEVMSLPPEEREKFINSLDSIELKLLMVQSSGTSIESKLQNYIDSAKNGFQNSQTKKELDNLGNSIGELANSGSRLLGSLFRAVDITVRSTVVPVVEKVADKVEAKLAERELRESIKKELMQRYQNNSKE